MRGGDRRPQRLPVASLNFSKPIDTAAVLQRCPLQRAAFQQPQRRPPGGSSFPGQPWRPVQQ